MLEADVRQQDDGCVDDVRRVEASAEPCLDDRRADAAVGEVREGGCRQRLELRRVYGFGRAADRGDGTLERLGIGVEALMPAAHVR